MLHRSFYPLGDAMIFAHLVKHWRGRRPHYSFGSWLLCIARSLRVLLYYREHQALCRLDVYRHYVAQAPGDDLFNHLNHRDYLVRGLSARQRIACALFHYGFEDANFGAAYKQMVYGGAGLVLWQRQGG